MTASTTLRNADLPTLMQHLRAEQDRKLDIVTPASKLHMRDGYLIVSGIDAEITEDGVTQVDGRFRVGGIFNEGLASRLDIPPSFLHGLHAGRPDLYDGLVNGKLHGKKRRHADGTLEVQYPEDQRQHLLRLFRGDETTGTPGYARAWLSNRFKFVEHIDILMALMEGVAEAGVQVEVKGADLSERRMYVRLTAPEVVQAAEVFLRRYQSPFTGRASLDDPRVQAGIVFGNSEVGNGAWWVAPQITVLVCTNGMTRTQDMVRGVHLGEKLDAGQIKWSADTQEKNVALVRAKARDAIAQFLTPGYLSKVVEEASRLSVVELDRPNETIEYVGKRLQYSTAEQDRILAMFTRGGQSTAGGVAQAITAYAQEVSDPDRAAEFENTAWEAMALAAQRR